MRKQPEQPEPADRSDPSDPSDLARRLREAGSEALASLVRERAAELGLPAVRQALRNPHCSAEVVEEVAAQTRLLSFYEVRRDLALHPRTPEVLALRFVPGLYWRDLMELGLDTRLRPTLRRAADLQLSARLPQLALGEKMSLARRAGPGVLSQLRHDPSPRVMTALLDNPRLTEGVLAPVVGSAATAPAVLEVIAADPRWGVRYPLRLALARNPATPVATAWRILGTLRKLDLKPVAADPRLPAPVRQRARVLLGET
ncbi:MAG TPA: hypothetical protein VF173_29620 [Thermoanaerobaculia bacterium]|nr:hypothetical protein [Thermoanaerobaculia bacterium]